MEENPFSSPNSSDSGSRKENASRYRLCSFLGVTVGIALYLVRATAVLVYSQITSDIGGPNVDSGQIAWIPFFAADIPWSLVFDYMTYPSNKTAVAIYSFVVGLPWVFYGIAAIWLIRFVREKINTRKAG